MLGSLTLSGAPTPPSIPRSEPLAWVAGSAICGAAAFGATLALLWRDLPGLPAPAGDLMVHAGFWVKAAVHHLMPAFHEVAASEYAKYIHGLAQRGELAPLTWRAGLAAAVATLPALALARSSLAPRDGLLHARGGARHSGASAVRRLNSKLKEPVKRRPDHFISPRVQYPADLWTQHVLVVGGVGAGKSRLVVPLVARVIARGEKLIAFDPKGELTSAFSEPALIAPWDARSRAWDIASDASHIGAIRAFAEAVIPDEPQAFWVNASREILVGHMRHLNATRASLWGWAELANAISAPIAQARAVMLASHPQAAPLLQGPPATSQGILATLAAHCSWIFDLALAWQSAPGDRRVSISEWALAEPRDRQLFIQGHGSHPALTRALAQGITGVLAGLASSPELEDSFDRKLWLIADEFAQMGKCPLESLCATGRSKGFRVVMATQDFAQLEKIHGKESVQALMSMCGTLVVGRTGPGSTAEALCRALGSREVERRGVSVSSPTGGAGSGSTSVSFTREDLALYKPSELATRLGPAPDGKSVVMALATGGDIYELAWPIEGWTRLRAPHEPAAWIAEPAQRALWAPGSAELAASELSLLSMDTEDPFAGLEGLDEARGDMGEAPEAPPRRRGSMRL